MTRARVCVFYSLGFSLGDYEQAKARLARPGQTRSVLFLHLIVEDSVDERVYEKLQERKDVIEGILSGWKNGK